MKIKILSKSAAVLLAVVFVACGGGESSTEKTVNEKPKQESTAAESVAPVITEDPEDSVEEAPELTEGQPAVKISGKDKVANSDCLSCHYMDKYLIGPSFLDIASEYQNTEENIEMLADKVIKGGTGVWGETAMPPHATLSKQDANDMVEYILSLK